MKPPEERKLPPPVAVSDDKKELKDVLEDAFKHIKAAALGEDDSESSDSWSESDD